MARVFISDLAAGLNDGTNWANAYTSLVTAIAASSANDILAIANTHSQNGDGLGNITFSANCQILCSTVSGVDTITATKATSALYFTDLVGDDVIYDFNNGTAYGLWFAARRTIFVRRFSSRMCTWQNTYNVARLGWWSLGISNSSDKSIDDTFLCNTTPADGILTNDSAKVMMIRMNLDVGGWTASDKIFDSNARGTLIVEGGDVSSAAATTLVDLNDSATIFIRDLAINASVTSLATASPSTVGGEVQINTSDSDTNSQRQYVTAFTGEALSDSGITLDSETPAAQKNSLKLSTNTNAVEWLLSLRVLIGFMWVDLSTAKTFTIEIAQDGTATPLTDSEFNVEVDYPDDLTTSRLTDNSQGAFDSVVSVPSSAAAWVGLSGTNVKQKASVTTTQTSKAGLVGVYVNLSKPSSNVYVDTKIVVS